MTNNVQVTFSVDEFNRLNAEASRNGRTLSEYLHDLAVGKRTETQAMPTISLETQDVGSNLERRRGRRPDSPTAE